MKNAFWWVMGGGIALVLLIITVPLLINNQQGTEIGIGGGPGFETGNGVDVGDIVDDPGRFVGQVVTVTSEVEEAFSNNAFTLDSIGEAGNELLVISREGVRGLSINGDIDLFDEQVVRVTGTVREFRTVDVEREFGIDLDDNLFADWEGRPYIAAAQVENVGQ